MVSNNDISGVIPTANKGNTTRAHITRLTLIYPALEQFRIVAKRGWKSIANNTVINYAVRYLVLE